MTTAATVALIDYGAGNVPSVERALQKLGVCSKRVTQPRELSGLRAVILPGVGHFAAIIRALDEQDLRAALLDAIEQRVPFLGICLGLQMLFENSEEGPTPGLGVFAGRVVRFREAAMVDGGRRLKVPHMGWSPVRRTLDHPLWRGIDDGTRFYFAHSYYPVPDDAGVTAATVAYPTAFTCAIARANIFAVQFHPEKSHRAGLQLLSNFVAWNGRV